jgi:fructosamine-3-kinase
MTPTTLADVARQITSAVGESLTIQSYRSVSGDCINNASIIECSNGERFFLKSNPAATKAMFAAETDGLRSMSATNSIRIPEVICFGSLESGGAFLVLESIVQGSRSRDYFECFGRQLANMHRLGRSEQFGFKTDNWLGSTVQPNPWSTDWISFWIQSRIDHQLKLAIERGFSNSKLQRLGKLLIDRVGDIFGSTEEPPSLIHGDLWSGNYLADETAQPVLIDPACYYANREAEFGMTTLFGGFPTEFYDAYQEAWPLAEGWETRVEIYRLYHLLNHLNLFGSSYMSGCLEILKRHV